MRVVFAGTPEFAATALQALIEAGHEVPLVLTQPDRPAGRGMKLQASAVKQVALQHGIAVAQPLGLRLDGKYAQDAAQAQAALLQARPDVMVVAAYGLILPAWTLELPRLGCLNIHASLLPRWRGAAPIHRAIEAGDTQTGITIMQMDQGLDTGDMLLVEALQIGAQETTAQLHDRLAAQGARLVVQALAQAEHGPLPRTPQPSEGITYAHKIEKHEAALDWQQDAQLLAQRLRAFDPFPGGVTQAAGEALKVWAATVVEVPGLESALPGEIVALHADGPVVRCGQGALCLTQLQRAGGKRLSAAQLMQSRPFALGERLG
ncbi:methionyl-tRNA formyltransferase [Roseateles sp. BYS180W]|uniref:Methionyl-tRNA formyltransferase n=1 Tax=Roseateles rivi TaxID=3299028 RepID=A0ABW7FWL5_9BURK